MFAPAPTDARAVRSMRHAPVAQWIERSPPEREVAGSNPAGRARRKACACRTARRGAPDREKDMSHDMSRDLRATESSHEAGAGGNSTSGSGGVRSRLPGRPGSRTRVVRQVPAVGRPSGTEEDRPGVMLTQSPAGGLLQTSSPRSPPAAFASRRPRTNGSATPR